MSHHYAETLDIHGGGADLIFPHHENERAQSEAAYNVPITSIWIHNGMLNINKEKMSKSLGNIILLKEVTSRYNPQAFRFYLLQHGYRAPLNFSDQDFEAATKAYERLPLLGKDIDTVQTKEELFAYLNHSNRFDAFEAAHCALLDDLNTPQALGSIFGALGTIKQSKELTLVCASFLYHLMGLSYQSNKSPSDLSDEIKELIEKRTTARQERDWKTADEIRDKLSQMGYDVQDKKL
jgi:cysteinyl-tRNA synthetase